MYGEIPDLEDVHLIMTHYVQATHPGLKRQYLRTAERILDDLLALAEKAALSGYDMGEWRRRLTVPYDAEFNRMVTDYCEAIEHAQNKLFRRPTFEDKLRLSGRKSPHVENAFYREWKD